MWGTLWVQLKKHFPRQVQGFWVRSWSLAHAEPQGIEGSFCDALECLVLELVLDPRS